MTGIGERGKIDTSQEESQTRSNTLVMGTGVAGEAMFRVGLDAYFQFSFFNIQHDHNALEHVLIR